MFDVCVFFFSIIGSDLSECSCDCDGRKKSRGLFFLFLNWFCLSHTVSRELKVVNLSDNHIGQRNEEDSDV